MSGIFLGVASLALTAYGAYSSYEGAQAQKKAAQNAAAVDTASSAFNNKIDQSQAEQIDLDTLQNIQTERQDGRVYLSREAAGYAASGVIATTGSALHAQLTNVGRFTQRIQQQYQDAQIKEQNLYLAGQEGVILGEAQSSADLATASAYATQANLALINGASRIAGESYSLYEGGVI